MVAVRLIESFKYRLACQPLKAGSGIDQTSIKKNQPSDAIAAARSARAIATARRRNAVASTHGSAKPSPCQLVFDDPPSGLFYDSVAASAKLGEQG
jgi:hypothetical protein